VSYALRRLLRNRPDPNARVLLHHERNTAPKALPENPNSSWFVGFDLLTIKQKTHVGISWVGAVKGSANRAGDRG
jgi:hypothetical protein